MDSNTFLTWVNKLMVGFADAGTWLVTPIADIEPFKIAPITLITFGGLTAFIVVAIVKWVIS